MCPLVFQKRRVMASHISVLEESLTLPMGIGTPRLGPSHIPNRNTESPSPSKSASPAHPDGSDRSSLQVWNLTKVLCKLH
jgi:hypothetical protein